MVACLVRGQVRKTLCLITILFSTIILNANKPDKKQLFPSYSVNKYGTLIGIQRGNYFNIQLGAELQRKQIKLKNPKTIAALGLIEYAWETNTVGLKVGSYFKTGRAGFTMGANFTAISDFDNYRIGISPALGFKFIGFHGVLSYNALFYNRDVIPYNNLHLSIRYFITRKRKVKKK